MSLLDFPTSQIAIDSSLHGRLRRVQRDITKRNLQEAVKYGFDTRVRGRLHPKHGPTWIYTWADITYVTDDSSRLEITAWAAELPLERHAVLERDTQQHIEAKRRIAMDPSIITSHQVFVVDMSSSMQSSDMNGHKSRFRAVYYSLAEEFTASHIAQSPSFTGTEVATLIEMHDDGDVIFEMEPIGPVLYNTFVGLSERPAKRAAHSHGNYLPSLRKAFDLIRRHDHEKCAPTLFFLTDGCPSDHVTMGRGNSFLPILLLEIELFCRQFADRLTLLTVGYGNASFDVLEAMVRKAQEFNVKRADLLRSSIDPEALSTAMSSIITSTTEMRTLLSRLTMGNGDESRVLRSDIRKAAASASFLPSKLEWRKYLLPPGEGVLDENSARKADHGKQTVERFTIEFTDKGRARYKKISFLTPAAFGIAVDNEVHGVGAEREVFEMSEVDSAGLHIGMPLVAKENKFQQRREAESFHLNFMRTQYTAGVLAKKFNAKLDSLLVDRGIPRIEFLPCFVYSCKDAEGNRVEFLSEAKLNKAKYVKYNDNAGNVDGVGRINQEAMAAEMLEEAGKKTKPQLAALEEGDEDEESEDEAEVVEDGPPLPKGRIVELQIQVLPSDVPQAFTHWTYRYTQRERMVCDLQGELVSTPTGPVFAFTDPCIHSKKADSRRTRRTDRTDKGSKGMSLFMRTHHCNALCEILGNKTGGK